MSIAEQINALDFKTKDGIEAARRLLLEYSRDHIIDVVKRRISSFEVDEHDQSFINAYLQVIDDIDKGLVAIHENNLFLQPQAEVKITPWDDIKVVDREWLIPNWLPANSTTLFTGQGGAGKSWLTLQIISQIAAGYGEWAGLNPDVSPDADPSPTCNVVLATYEDEPAEIQRRLHALASSIKWIDESLPTIKQNLHIVDMRGVGSVWGPGLGNHIANTGDLLSSGEQLQHICEEVEAGLLVIDPLSGAFGGNENDRTAVYDFISAMRKWGDTAKCAILVVGHLPKGKEAKDAGFSGSTAWEASVRSLWMLHKEGDDDDSWWELSHVKSNYAPLQMPIALIKSHYGWWEKADSEEDAIEGFKNYKQGFKEDTDNENRYAST
jgi:RecA-family ATPase